MSSSETDAWPRRSYSAFTAQVFVRCSADQSTRDLGAHRSAAEAEDVQVVVFDALASRKVILDECRAHAGDLVGANRNADAAAAQRQTAFDLTARNGAGEGDDEVGIVVAV